MGDGYGGGGMGGGGRESAGGRYWASKIAYLRAYNVQKAIPVRATLFVSKDFASIPN